MERVADFLGATLRRMKNPEAAQAWLKARWAVLVGEPLAAHIQPASLANRVLYLRADSLEWKAQAEMMSEELLERVNRDWGGTLIHEVRVETQKSARVRHEFDNNHVPFLRKHAKPKP